MPQLCNYCINKNQCNECDKKWKDKFIPSDDVRKYFNLCYVGVHGINGRTYSFNNTNEDLVSTHCVLVGYTHYCPYCGEAMWPIQDKKTLDVIGYCCICQGARDEIEYETKLKKLKEKHDAEIAELNRGYSNKLAFCTDKLLEAKQQYEKQRITGLTYNHMATRNGRRYSNIEDMI